MGTTDANKIRGNAPELQPYWDWRAAGNFILGGTGSGLLFFAVFAAPHDQRMFVMASLAGLALIGAGLGCVFIELGTPMRALNVFLRPQTSWMSREAMAATVLFPVVFAPIVFPIAIPVWLGGALALVFLYCQARVLKAAKGIPAFRDAAIIALIVLTGLAEGGALLIILGTPLGFTPRWLLATTAILVAGRLYAWRSYLSSLSAPGASPKATVGVLAAIDRPLSVAGHAVPLLFLLIAFILPGGPAALGWVGAVFALLAGAHLKFTIITRASYNQGFALLRAPARTPGFSRPGAKPGWT